MQTLLICGGTKEERIELARQKAKNSFWEDLIILEGEESLGIGQIRQLEHQLNLKPYRSPHKTSLLVEAQRLTIPAQNALLKTLEEPPQKTLIILTTPTRESLLPTIVSRCQVIELPPKPEVELSDEEFQNLLSSVSCLLSPGVGERLIAASKWAKTRHEALDFCDKQTAFWRKIFIEKLQTSPNIQQLSNLTMKQLITIFRRLGKTKEMIAGNVNPRLALEIFFLDLPSCHRGPTSTRLDLEKENCE